MNVPPETVLTRARAREIAESARRQLVERGFAKARITWKFTNASAGRYDLLLDVVPGVPLRLRLTGKDAHEERSLAVGDEVRFDPERAALVEILPRRTTLARLRSFKPGREQVIAANVDRLAIVTSVSSPPFRPGAVDRFLLAARAGGLDALLVVNKLDLLEKDALPDEIAGYAVVVPIFACRPRAAPGSKRSGARSPTAPRCWPATPASASRPS
jgi:putative ribosome biogenesis GTPase RsgA